MRLFLRKIIEFSLYFVFLYGSLILCATFKLLPVSIPKFPAMFGGLRYSNLRWIDAEKNTQADVLIVGSSHAYRGFNPFFFQQKGLKAFNLGSSNQTPNLSYLYTEIYTKRWKPKYLIIECFWEMFNYPGIEAAADGICNHPDANIRQQIFEYEPNLTTFHCLCMTWIRRMGIPYDQEKTQMSDHLSYQPGGYVSCTTHGSVIEPIPTIKKLQPQGLSYIEKMIQQAQKEKTTAILVMTPVSHYYFSHIPNYTRLTQPLTDLAQKYHISFLDFHQFHYADFHDNQHFSDSHHLNEAGVVLMNELFLQKTNWN